MFRGSFFKLCLCLPWIVFLEAQSTGIQLESLLERETLGPDLVRHRLEAYLKERSPRLPAVPSRAEDWTTQAGQTRQKLLREVVYRGWPRAWVEAPLRFSKVGGSQKREGYRLQKLLLEVLPGLQIPQQLLER